MADELRAALLAHVAATPHETDWAVVTPTPNPGRSIKLVLRPRCWEVVLGGNHFPLHTVVREDAMTAAALTGAVRELLAWDPPPPPPEGRRSPR